MKRLFLSVLFVLAFPSLTRAYQLAAKVVGIVDGDTITVVDESNRSAEVRLQGIDAPEHGQALAPASQAHLSHLVFGKQVELDCINDQSYGRIVCKVLLPNGEDVDLAQVKEGLAWHYKQYAFSQSTVDRQAYAAAEDAARQARLGLWSDAHPTQPQDYRHGTRSPLCLDYEDHRVACSDLYKGPVRGNRRSSIYHWPGCPNYDDIAEQNRVEFPSAAVAEAEGFRAARNCP